MSREKRRSRKTDGHTSRNILILGLTLVAVAVAAALLSASPGPRFFMTIHVYDAPAPYPSYEELPASALVENSTITIRGPRDFGPETTPTGVLAISTEVPSGNYAVTAGKAGYNPGSIEFVVGNGCSGKQVLPDGSIACHALVRITSLAPTQ